jgi:hypothetical protein
MAAKSLFSDAHREMIHELYMRRMMQPAAITTALNDRFKTSFALVQVQRLINARWSGRRKRLLNRVRAVEKMTDNQLVTEHTKKNRAALERWSGKAEKLADKALDHALATGDARTMSAASATAKNSISMFRICSGIDGPAQGGRSTFNFNFGNITPTPAGAEINVTPVNAESIDDDEEPEDFGDGDDGDGPEGDGEEDSK